MSETSIDRAISIVIPGGVVPKGRHRSRVVSSKFVHNYPAPTTVKYENLIKLAADEAMGERAPMTGPLRMVVAAYLIIPQSWSKKKQERASRGEERPAKRPDLDNFVKAALDGCNQIVYVDDAQVVRLEAAKVYSERPRLEIRVEPVISG